MTAPDRSEARPLLVGELNPFGGDESFALYPLPRNCAGDRLCRLVMGLGAREYLRLFDRANLCRGRWSMRAARERAEALLAQYPAPAPLVLLGRKVATAFGGTFDPFTWHRTAGAPNRAVVTLPHPSGLCRLWNAPGAFERARAVLREAGVLPPC